MNLKPRLSIPVWLRVACWVRDAWLILGVAVAIWLGLELVYRAEGALRREAARLLGHATRPRSPYADSSWYAEFLTEEEASFRLRWVSYVYWRRRPLRGKYINVDSLGHRRTVQAAPVRTGGRRIFFFGGSTMFGLFQRDAWTIPSLVAARFAAHGLDNVDITNFGETGYVYMQEVLELLLQLRSGVRPDVVVFYDGINDVAAAVQNGLPGLPQNEANRAREFEIGRTLFTRSTDATAEACVLATLARLGAGRSQLLDRLARLVHPARRPPLNVDSLAGALATTYVATGNLVEALSRRYGFDVIYIWQPCLFTTRKRLTPYERAVASEIAPLEFHRLQQQVHEAVRQPIQLRMQRVALGRFLNLSGLFDAETTSVYMDVGGHITEAANGLIVDSIVARLMPLLSKRVRKRQGSPTPPQAACCLPAHVPEIAPTAAQHER